MAVVCALGSACDVRSKRIEVPIVPDGPNRLRYHSETVLLVDINRDGVKTLGDSQISSDSEMLDIFTREKARNPHSGIGIRADARAPFESVSTVMLLAHSAGISNIYMTVGERGKTGSGESITVEQNLKIHLK